MAGFSEALGIDPKILDSRFRFLSARAQWHSNQAEKRGRDVPGTPEIHVACAATLRRDAGAIALILGWPDQARSEFDVAGRLRLGLGCYDGLYLLRLGEPRPGDSRRIFGDASDWLERSLNGGERDGLPRFAVAASSSPRQLVSIIQAAGAVNTPLEGAARVASERLQVYGVYPLGVTQTPVLRYLDLFHELRNGHLNNGRRTLIAMSAQRAELIAAAQRDRFHWRLAQQPADLIDMDLLSIALTALERGEDLFSRAQGIAEEFGPIARIPFEAARQLRPPPPPSETSWRYDVH